MSPADIRAARRLLDGLWAGGKRIPSLPDELRPANRAEGYAIQALIEEADDAPRFGWKIAATSLAGQAHINVSGPMAGRILASRVVPNGGSFALGANLMRVAELEFAFRFARRIVPRTAAWSIEDALLAVASLHPAIEIPDSRIDPFEQAGEAQLIADNACACLFVLGQAAPDAWREHDLKTHALRGSVGDGVWRPGIGSAVLGDPRIALVWFLEEMSRLGCTLEPGEVVTTGTCLEPLEIGPGMTVTGDFGSIGGVSVSVC